MSTDEIKDLIDVFNSLDTNNDGELSFEEFQNGVSQLKKETAEEIMKVFNKLDADKNGSIEYTEFIAASMTQKMYLKEEKIYQAFKLFDKNGDGFITQDEIKEVLGSKFLFLNEIEEEFVAGKSGDIWEELVKEADTNGDGVIDYNEFITLMSKM